MAFENPFTALKDMPKPARYAVIAGVTGITGYLLYSHHAKTGSWNPWNAGTKTTSGGQAADINPVTGQRIHRITLPILLLVKPT